MPPPAKTWTSKKQLVDHLGMVEREIDRDSASKRQTNQRCVLHGEMLQEGVEISLGLERRVGGTRTAETPGIGTDDTKVGCHNPQLLVPYLAREIATVA